ncbi:MAG: threonine ammonia-lyase, partial [Solirubrobacteraceae bacterium]
GTVVLKAECLQRTGSFKLRGALEKLRHLPADTRGVIAGSAGNHGQSLAYAARARGISCEVYMPLDAPVSKSAAVSAFGAQVHREGESVEDCLTLARQRALQSGLEFVHPFDDEDVIAGQGGVGIELCEQVPDLSQVLVPIGGGGLASGLAVAIKDRRPEVRIVGVQASACAAVVESLRGGGSVQLKAGPTIADGIAVKRPGEKTLALIERLLDDLVCVSEEEIAEAMVFALERSKLVVEGAGAASLAALLSSRVKPPPSGATVAVLSGGNVDIGLLAGIAARQETRAGRRVRLFTHIRDRPGGLASLLAAVAHSQANVIAVEHIRDGVPLAFSESGLALTIETRGPNHLASVLEQLRGAGYEIREEQ